VPAEEKVDVPIIIYAMVAKNLQVTRAKALLRLDANAFFRALWYLISSEAFALLIVIIILI